MKHYFSLLFLFSYLLSIAQIDGKFGITLGATNYITDTSILSSKSGTGFTIGVMGVTEFNDNLSLVTEINFNHHSVKFIGRENELAEPEDLNFNLQEFSIPITINYFVYEINGFKFGLNAGPSFHFIHEYKPKDDSKELYLLDPLYVSPYDLLFDTRNEKVSFNVFAAVGVSIQYDEDYMINLKYYHGITDPYRQVPIVSRTGEITGQDSYFSFGFTYFL